MNNKFYITTTLPYVNADPHIGFAAEIIKADVIARWRRLNGDEVFFNTGTDEHGQKIYEKALAAGKQPKEYCDEYAAKFGALKDALNLTYNSFIRTTDEKHIKAAQAFWQLCEKNGDIYKKNYKVKYCVGCELEKTDSELVNGCCEFHPGKELQIIEEENYFFKFSKYQKPLLELYEKNPDFVKPDWRLNEIKSFVERGLEDFSISRLASKMPWGIPVPGDESQVMYVWFDALVNYISCLDWPCDHDECNYQNFWPGLQVCGKDNLRQQTAMWQSMLMSAGLPTSKQVLVFGFITLNGQKMSKSTGNTVNPLDLVAKYGADASRYYLLREIKPFADSDFSFDKFEILYNAELANGIGNLAARVATLLEKNEIETELQVPDFKHHHTEGVFAEFKEQMMAYAFDEALAVIIKKATECDMFLAEKKPWKMEDKVEIKTVLEKVAQDILNISFMLEPFMPSIAKKLQEQYLQKQIKKGDNLFPRLVAEVKK